MRDKSASRFSDNQHTAISRSMLVSNLDHNNNDSIITSNGSALAKITAGGRSPFTRSDLAIIPFT